jgi:signal transduction histidine kinase
MKFTKGVSISVIVEKRKGDENNNNNKCSNQNEVIISVKDTGSEIFPSLFSKFVTKSSKGTGLGLFISKSIIEAHGGKIWAENNSDIKGATFSFSLPIK